jgi:hypothetical protein
LIAVGRAFDSTARTGVCRHRPNSIPSLRSSTDFDDPHVTRRVRNEQGRVQQGPCRRWFTDFWGKNVKLAVIDEIAAPDMLLKYSAARTAPRP